MDKQKSTLVDALVRLGCAQVDTYGEKQRQTPTSQPEQQQQQQQPLVSTTSEIKLEDIDNTANELKKWIDLTDSKVCYSLSSTVRVPYVYPSLQHICTSGFMYKCRSGFNYNTSY